MSARRRTHAHSLDPVTTAGLAAQLRGHPEIEVIEPGPGADQDSVALCAVESTITDPVATMVRQARRYGCHRVVLVSTQPSQLDVMSAIDLGVCAIVPRHEASTHRLAHAVLSVANGEAAMPADLLARLIHHVAHLQGDPTVARSMHGARMGDRERQVLRLVADGKDTREIAHQLNYSERTVKNVLHDVTTRFQLRNRSQAVAYAVREGLI